jgi:hypothetical protein
VWGSSAVAERRSVPRHSVTRRATALAAGFDPRGCLVLNLSDRGARLAVGSAYQLPSRFELAFRSGQRVKVMLIWQHGLVAGVAFDRPHAGLLMVQRFSDWRPKWFGRRDARRPRNLGTRPIWFWTILALAPMVLFSSDLLLNNSDGVHRINRTIDAYVGQILE